MVATCWIVAFLPSDTYEVDSSFIPTLDPKPIAGCNSISIREVLDTWAKLAQSYYTLAIPYTPTQRGKLTPYNVP